MDLICSGVQEHYLELRCMDIHMQSTSLIADRLRDADCLAATGHRKAEFGLIKYSPALALNVRRLVTGTDRYAFRAYQASACVWDKM